MNKGLKEKVINLYKEGFDYEEIRLKLNCSKGTISYHCSRLSREERPDRKKELYVNKYTKDKVEAYQEYYDICRSLRQTANHFGLCRKSLSKYVIKKDLTKDELRNFKRIAQGSYRKRTKIVAVAYKGGACQKCGYSKSLWALDFHHLDPNKKDFVISGGTKKFETIKTELDKCILVCKNCHAEIHEDLHNKNQN
jgi:hypothetical protein